MVQEEFFFPLTGTISMGLTIDSLSLTAPQFECADEIPSSQPLTCFSRGACAPRSTYSEGATASQV